ncbi:DUF1311 domain-containing protein [Acinetobacter indicus]|uniref:lysozyme inhibitor LprI family protein n=1 Tax=Acinetobacter indicus TaxID=756892 RepID=UPI0025755B4F|nr:lysozyme inhibitor LprI family protein [Acinetobacter indicus]MDM1310706.1 DUF1311 domain-containing protein [Acinetobacter indicus]
MRKYLVIILTLFIPQWILAANFKYTNYEKQIDVCYGKKATTDSLSCFVNLNEKLDIEVRNKYNSLVKVVEQELTNSDNVNLQKYDHQLRLAQNAWEIYINLSCQAVSTPYFEGSGMFGEINLLSCSAEEKVNRIKALDSYYPR